MSQNATTVVLDLSVNEPFCWNLSGLPARVVTDHDDCNNNRYNDEFVVAIRLPGVEVTGLYDAIAISKLLQTYLHLDRQVLLSDTVPALSAMVRSTHALPTTSKEGTPSSNNSSLGIVFDGFPAKVKSVDSQSPYCNYIPAQQAVHAVTVPGKSTLCFESGGFTGHRIQTYLEETAHILGRQLILEGQPGAYTETKVEQLASKNRSPPPTAPAGGQWGKASSTWTQLLWKSIVCCCECLGCICFVTCIICLESLGGGGSSCGGGSGLLPNCPCEQDEEMDAYMAPNGILYSPNGRVMGDGKSHRFKVTTIG